MKPHAAPPCPESCRIPGKGIIRRAGTVRIVDGHLAFAGWEFEGADAHPFRLTPEGPLFYGYTIDELIEIAKRPFEFVIAP